MSRCPLTSEGKQKHLIMGQGWQLEKNRWGKSGATSDSILYLIGRHAEISAIDHHASNTVEFILVNPIYLKN